MKRRHGRLVALIFVVGILVWISCRTAHRTPRVAVAAADVAIPVRTTSLFPTTRLDEVIPEVNGLNLTDMKGHIASPKTGAEYLRYHEAGYIAENNYDHKMEGWFIHRHCRFLCFRK